MRFEARLEQYTLQVFSETRNVVKFEIQNGKLNTKAADSSRFRGIGSVVVTNHSEVMVDW